MSGSTENSRNADRPMTPPKTAVSSAADVRVDVRAGTRSVASKSTGSITSGMVADRESSANGTKGLLTAVRSPGDDRRGWTLWRHGARTRHRDAPGPPDLHDSDDEAGCRRTGH